METTSAGSFGEDSESAPDGKEKRGLTVGYIVAQTFKTIVQMVVQARIPKASEQTDYSAQWLNIKLNHLWDVERELQRAIPRSKVQSSDDVTQSLLIDIFADLSAQCGEKEAKSRSRHGRFQVLLERWTLKFTSGSNKEPDLPATINDKWSIVLTRSIYSLLRLLPAYKLVRRCKKQPTPSFTLGYALLPVDTTTLDPPAARRAGLLEVPAGRKGPSFPRPRTPTGQKADMKTSHTFSLGSVVSETGTLSADVEYATDLAIFEQEGQQFTIDPFVISDYIPARSEPISIASNLQRGIAQSAPAMTGFNSMTPTPISLNPSFGREQRGYGGSEEVSPMAAQHPRPVYDTQPQYTTPLYTPQPRSLKQDVFQLSSSPPSPPTFHFEYAPFSTSAPPTSSVPIDHDRPPSPFIISNTTTLSTSPTEELEPEVHSFYLRDKHGRRTLSISPPSSPSPYDCYSPAVGHRSNPLSPAGVSLEDDDPQFSEPLEQRRSESDVDAFVLLCSNPPNLRMFDDARPVAWIEDLKSLQQFLSSMTT